MTELMHYRREPIVFDPNRTYRQHEPTTFGKPNGLWVSVTGEDDWPSWCGAEAFNVDQLAVAHRVTLKPDASVCVIDNEFELHGFTRWYAVQTEYELRWAWRAGDIAKWPIDWRQVAEHYAGVIIAPYQWSCRSSHDWYYGWDCASGCVWDLSAVASVELVDAEVSA